MNNESTNVPPHDMPTNENFEEECVICLEELTKNNEWGRCTPCNHAFHKKCWWQWENSHRQRIATSRRQGNDVADDGPKCCLCNTVVQQFVDGEGEPAHNPEPFVAEDDSDENKNFFDWFFRRDRGAGQGGDATNEPNNMNGAIDYLERMSRLGGSVMGMDPAVLLDQLRFGGGFGFPSDGVPNTTNSSNNNNNNSNFGFDLGRMFQEWGAGIPGVGSRSSSNVDSTAHDGSFNQIRPGTQIVIQDLVTSPNLNRQRGKVQGFNQQTGRYLINVDSNNMTVFLKPENVLQIITVKILGLVSQPQFNGREGTIVSYNKERNRYVVRVAYLPNETKEISIKACNIRIPDLSKVRLEGLENQSQWNGRYGEFGFTIAT